MHLAHRVKADYKIFYDIDDDDDDRRIQYDERQLC